MEKRVAVIGAGPAGLYAAREAATRGLSVTVYCKGAVGENISCAEGFFDLLKLLDKPTAGVCFPVEEIQFTVKDHFSLDSSKLNLCMIDRAAWQSSLAREAAALGCTFSDHTTITPEGLAGLRQTYDWIIDASGASPVTAAVLPLEPVAFAQTAQQTLHGDFSALWGKIKAVAEPHYCGYYWIFPKSPESANVGIGWFARRPPGVSISAELNRVIAKENLEHCPVLKKAGGPIPVSRRKSIVWGNILLAGDAAGLASPLHGGGIDCAAISGVLAARALASGNPAGYGPAVETVLGKRLNLEKKILDVWNEMEFNNFNDFIALSFGKPTAASSLSRLRQAVTREAAILRYVVEGNVSADWEKGINLDGLPLVTRLIVQRLMNGDG